MLAVARLVAAGCAIGALIAIAVWLGSSSPQPEQPHVSTWWYPAPFIDDADITLRNLKTPPGSPLVVGDYPSPGEWWEPRERAVRVLPD